jgi:hypothetical protein
MKIKASSDFAGSLYSEKTLFVVHLLSNENICRPTSRCEITVENLAKS